MKIYVTTYNSLMRAKSYELAIEDKTYSGNDLKSIILQNLEMNDTDSYHLLNKDKINITSDNGDKERDIYDDDLFYIVPKLIAGLKQ